jgi:hypothetical protein
MKARVPFQLAEIFYQTEAAVFGLLGLYRMRDPGIGAGLCPKRVRGTLVSLLSF